MTAPRTPGVYLLHFENKLHHAQHYIGWAKNIRRRVKAHCAGTSRAHLTQAVCAAGIGITLARVWEGEDRTLERHLKSWKKARRLCPICRGEV